MKALITGLQVAGIVLTIIYAGAGLASAIVGEENRYKELKKGYRFRLFRFLGVALLWPLLVFSKPDAK